MTKFVYCKMDENLSSHGINPGDGVQVIKSTNTDGARYYTVQTLGYGMRTFLADRFQDTDPNAEEVATPWATQVGGDHYKKVEGYQPFQISHACGLSPIEHTVLKYLLRHRRKGGADDLRKAQHCLDLLIEQEYKCTPT